MLEPTNALLKKSWERSRINGVNALTAKDAILEETQFRQYREQKEEFMRTMDPTMERLAYWLKSSYSIVALCDTSGYILESKGDPVFLKDTEKIQVHHGACWSEQVRGTNSAGTVIVEQKPLAVVGKDHYLDSNHMLYCAASPIFGPQGELVAVLDISGHAAMYHPSLLGMVDVMARKVEDWLLIHRPDRQMVISLYPEKNAKHHALLAVNQDGIVTGGNREAHQLLRGNRQRLEQVHVTELVADIESLLGRQKDISTPRSLPLLTKGGGEHHWQASVLLDTRPPQIAASPPSSKPKARPLRANRTGLTSFDDLYGTDDAFLAAIRLAKRAAKTEYTVMLFGESGSGKDVVSQAIHLASERADKPFVAINCGAIPKSLLESELFGYEPGAFTGAKQTGQPGKFEQAHQGTLFLDEIAEMPSEMQVALLRVLQDFTVYRVGGTKPIHVDVRIITATHTDLWQKVQEGSFRADLFYRLQGVQVTLPPLRERADRLQLAQLLLHGIEAQLGTGPLALGTSAKKLIESYSWPGNVRQLAAALREAAFLSEGGKIERERFPAYILSSFSAKPAEGQISDAQKERTQSGKSDMVDVFLQTGGNISETARILGIGRNTVYRKLKKLMEKDGT
ncbi:sigma-54-dependent Fis family transcriptional regulator [Brevibacillus parabrevis]|uniref:sigma-54-dependent Fis family transcriptional regulator n=1 Tax=Brevibacillus parabrevis TaxID=54914 RepID=UPI001F611DC3|nr:sigma-54-dependent Fis family transcriptional regulator [Brevibacillus parabrevis]